MEAFDVNSLIGTKIEDAIVLLNKNGFLNIIQTIYSSDKVKKSDTLVVIKATIENQKVELLLGEFLYKLS